jgi:hypothetical protein
MSGHVAECDAGLAVLLRQEIEVVAADLRRRAVVRGDGRAREMGRIERKVAGWVSGCVDR